MKIHTRLAGANCVIALAGRLDAHNADDVSEAVKRAAANLAGDLILDMASVETISSAGVRSLLIAYQTMTQRPGKLEIINVRPIVQQVLRICQLSRLLGTEESMTLRVWGARGSLPTPLDSAAIEEKILWALRTATSGDVSSEDAARRFLANQAALAKGTAGGNTACVEVRLGGRVFILDAGSGLRPLGQRLMGERFGEGKGRAHLFVSHTHWDHIMGFPFFAPAYVAGNEIEIHGGHADLEARFVGQQPPEYFPVPLSAMAANIGFHVLSETRAHDLEGIIVRMSKMNHPGGSFSYRLQYGDKSVVYATDVELQSDKLDPYIDFFANADVLILDSQYSLEETVAKQDWGHSSPLMGADIAAEANVKTFLMFHHEPTATDEDLTRSLEGAREYLRHSAPDSQCTIDVAWEGLEMTL